MIRALTIAIAISLFAGGLAAEAQKATVSAPELSQAISQSLMRVEEFQFIREEARRMGVRVYLFGGTAAGFAHYVKWDLLRQKGDGRYQADRFDYDFTNIYRSTQDLDVVVDGSDQQVRELQRLLAGRFTYFQGSKDAWEVRSLRESHGKPGTPGFKEALLNSHDFKHQNTDSNSVGMVELTESTDPIVRDLRDWQSSEPQFLRDLVNGQIHYYHHPVLHRTTARARNGQNPEIISVIRLLTKAFQYELSFEHGQWRLIAKIISDFNSGKDLQNEVAKNWVLRNGPKLFQHAVNVEYAWQILEKTGLRKKLMQLDDPKTIGSLAWWMNKKPLSSFEVGGGLFGKTAAELGIDVVAHETRDMLAFESITRAHTGEANVFISRQNAPDEAAAFGDGFYTRIGREGAKGTGLTIRFHLDRRAREGRDFELVKTADYVYVIIKNKRAIRVIPESLRFTVLQYFEHLQEGYLGALSDKGVREKAKRMIRNKSSRLSPEEEHKLVEIIRLELAKPAPERNVILLRDFALLPIAKKHELLFVSPLERAVYAVQTWDQMLDLAPRLAVDLDRLDLASRIAVSFGKYFSKNIFYRELGHQLRSFPYELNVLATHLAQADRIEDVLEVLGYGKDQYMAEYDGGEEIAPISDFISPQTRRLFLEKIVQWSEEKKINQYHIHRFIPALFKPLEAKGESHFDEYIEFLGNSAFSGPSIRIFSSFAWELVWQFKKLNEEERRHLTEVFQKEIQGADKTTAPRLFNFWLQSNLPGDSAAAFDRLLPFIDRIYYHSSMRGNDEILKIYLTAMLAEGRPEKITRLLDRANVDLTRALIRFLSAHSKEFLRFPKNVEIVRWFEENEKDQGVIEELARVCLFSKDSNHFVADPKNASSLRFFIENIRAPVLEVFVRPLLEGQVINLPHIQPIAEIALKRLEEHEPSVGGSYTARGAERDLLRQRVRECGTMLKGLSWN